MQFSQFVILATGIAAAGLAAAQGSFQVNTPAALIQCRPYQITWTGGQAPYFPRVTAAGQVSDTLKDFGSVNAQQVLWTVDRPVGSSVTFSVNDSAGQVANSAASPPIIAGSTECLNGAASSSNGPAPSSSAGASSSSSAAPTSSRSTATSSEGSASVRSTSTSSRSAPSNSPTPSKAANGASSARGYSAAVAGVVGIAAAALL